MDMIHWEFVMLEAVEERVNAIRLGDDDKEFEPSCDKCGEGEGFSGTGFSLKKA